MVSIYIALLREDGTEPDPESGYERADIGLCDMAEKLNILAGRQIAFPDVKAPGYGDISAAAVCDRKRGGKILRTWSFPVAQDCHEGVVPVIYNGMLYRGMEVQAKVTVNSDDLCGGM